MKNHINNVVHIKEVNTPIGNLFLYSNGQALIFVSQFGIDKPKILKKIQYQLLGKKSKKLKPNNKNNKDESTEIVFEHKNDKILNDTEKQLKEYFNKKRTEFDIPVINHGTDFQEKVWKKIGQIKYSKTYTYQSLSEKIKHPLAVRATASACAQNNIPIILACHRVVGKSGTLNGYSLGIKAKEFLLKHEGFIK